MIAIAGDRTILLSIFARRINPTAVGAVVPSADALPDAEVVAVFSENAACGDLPHTLIVGGTNLREFYAWSSTYLTHWSPLTAAVRVLKRAEVSRAFSTPVPFVNLSLSVRRGLFSLIIGELLCEWRLAGERSAPTLLSLRSTFGYVAMESIRRGSFETGKLLADWQRAQRILKLGPRRIDGEALLSVWDQVGIGLSGDGSPPDGLDGLAEAVREVIESGRLPIERFFDTLPLFAQAELKNVKQRREDAVVELEGWLAKHGIETPLDSFLAACLATRLSQSPLSHFDVLASMAQDESESLLWYSFLSGLLASDPGSQVIERQMYKLSNDFSRDPNERRGDVALDELDVLAQPDGSVPPWVGIGGGYLAVEIDIDVCSWFRVKNPAAGSLVARQVPNDVDRDGLLLDELLAQIRALYHRKSSPPPNKKRRRK